jgi:L-fuconolactonase
VIDHLGKPPIGSDRMDEWEALLRSCASHQNVYAKISGLNTSMSRVDWDVDDLIDPVRIAVDSFGPDRLMCGSDWPVALLNGDYDRVWGTLVEVLELVEPDGAPRILGETARDLYELDESIGRAAGDG